MKLIKSLDADKHSLTYLWLLSALLNQRRQLTKLGTDFNTVYELTSKFLQAFDPAKVTSQTARVYSTVSHFAEYLIAEQRPVYGIKLLEQTINRLQDNKE